MQGTCTVTCVLAVVYSHMCVGCGVQSHVCWLWCTVTCVLAVVYSHMCVGCGVHTYLPSNLPNDADDNTAFSNWALLRSAPSKRVLRAHTHTHTHTYTHTRRAVYCAQTTTRW